MIPKMEWQAKEIARLKEALEFYGNPENYNGEYVSDYCGECYVYNVLTDGGACARAALAETPEK